MKVTMNGGKVLIVTWRYFRNEEEIRSLGHPIPMKASAVTVCKVIDPDVANEDSKVLGCGESYCNHTDNFSRMVGRKVSLTKALSMLPKSDRTQVWNLLKNKVKIA
jgi:hypothetical protein